jgi:hypothetical protein
VTLSLVLQKAWSGLQALVAWCREHWVWIVFPVGVLLYLVGWLNGRDRSQVIVTTSPGESAGAKSDLRASEARVALEKERLEEEKRQQEAAALAEHAAQGQSVKAALKEVVPALLEDPDTLNAHLLQKGRQIRGTTSGSSSGDSS